jgi:peptidoglycan/xylan/chitin deacetylase (PgdA/CDA1 family)
VRVGRGLLYVSSASAIGLGIRSVTKGAVDPEVTAAAILGFSGIVLAGVLEPRLSMFVDAVHAGEPRPDRPRIALTFDDGPSVTTTPRVLDALAEAGAKATFFVIGRKLATSKEAAAIARRAHAEGHAIACHGFAHDRLFALRSARRVRQDLERALATIAEVVGVETKLFRPPIGHTNPTIARIVDELDLTVVGFSVRGYDGTRAAEPERVLERVRSRLADGAIVLLHDAAEREDFDPAAPRILPPLLAAIGAAGLAAVTVPALIGAEGART